MRALTQGTTARPIAASPGRLRWPCGLTLGPWSGPRKDGSEWAGIVKYMIAAISARRPRTPSTAVSHFIGVIWGTLANEPPTRRRSQAHSFRHRLVGKGAEGEG